MNDLPQVNDSVRVWYGTEFIRSGQVIAIDEQERMIFVEFIYDIPNEWVRYDQIC